MLNTNIISPTGKIRIYKIGENEVFCALFQQDSSKEVKIYHGRVGDLKPVEIPDNVTYEHALEKYRQHGYKPFIDINPSNTAWEEFFYKDKDLENYILSFQIKQNG